MTEWINVLLLSHNGEIVVSQQQHTEKKYEEEIRRNKEYREKYKNKNKNENKERHGWPYLQYGAGHV